MERMRRLTTIVAAWLLVTCLIAGCRDDRAATLPDGTLHGLVRTPRLDVGAVSLPEVSVERPAEAFPMKARPGGVLVVFFGYTGCGRRCDTSNAAVRGALHDLGSESDRVDVAMITVDPAADTPEKLSQYLAAEIGAPRMHALSTDDTVQQASAEAAFAAAARLNPGKDNTYTVSFTGSIYAVDEHGIVQCEWPFGTSATAIGADLRALLERAR